MKGYTHELKVKKLKHLGDVRNRDNGNRIFEQWKTMPLSLYNNIGWVFDKETDLGNEINLMEMGERLYEPTYEDYVEAAEGY